MIENHPEQKRGPVKSDTNVVNASPARGGLDNKKACNPWAKSRCRKSCKRDESVGGEAMSDRHQLADGIVHGQLSSGRKSKKDGSNDKCVDMVCSCTDDASNYSGSGRSSEEPTATEDVAEAADKREGDGTEEGPRQSHPGRVL